MVCIFFTVVGGGVRATTILHNSNTFFYSESIKLYSCIIIKTPGTSFRTKFKRCSSPVRENRRMLLAAALQTDNWKVGTVAMYIIFIDCARCIYFPRFRHVNHTYSELCVHGLFATGNARTLMSCRAELGTKLIHASHCLDTTLFGGEIMLHALNHDK